MDGFRDDGEFGCFRRVRGKNERADILIRAEARINTRFVTNCFDFLYSFV